MKRILILLAALALPVLAGGCSALIDPHATNRCAADDDCATGTCNVDRGMCVTVPPETLTVALEVLPSTDPIYGGTVQPFAFEPFALEGETELDLTLQPGIPMLGLVTDGLARPITADVSFTTSSRIPGVAGPSVGAQARTDTTSDGRGFDYNFASQLLPGRVYDVTVRPTGEWASELPPWRAIPYMSPEGDSARLTLSYPEPCSAAIINDPTSTASCLATIQGFVRNAAGEPVDGLSVRVVDPVSGQTLSSTDTTGTDTEPVAGQFEVVLPVERWRDLEGWLFRLTPTAERIAEHGPSQTFTVAPSALYEDDLGVITILTPEVPDIVDYAGWVEGPDGAPAVGANMQFISRGVSDATTGAVGSFTATATTQGDAEACRSASPPAECGLFEVSLLAGTYDIVITPSAGDPTRARSLAVLRVEERRIDPERPAELAPADHIPVMGQLFSLDERTALGGTVRTSGGESMIDATVRAQARGTDLGGELPRVSRYARTNMTVTDTHGMFAVDLDVGVYDIVVEPPTGSNYPWLVVPDRAIASNYTTTYDLENPVLVSGVAQFQNPDADGPATIPVANGEVRAYAVIETDDGGTRAVAIGRASTDMDGNYTLLLPPSL